MRISLAFGCASVWLWLGLSAQAADRWTDISSSLLTRLTNNGAKFEWPGGCSGVVVNRTNGAVTIKLAGLGLWQSADRGANWQRIDNETISGRDETGWATRADADAPARMASFPWMARPVGRPMAFIGIASQVSRRRSLVFYSPRAGLAVMRGIR